MNFYNPYLSAIPSYTPTASASRGLLASLFGGGKLSSFISGTQKTLGLVNQAIPLIKQMSPVMKNAKTMFKVMSEFKKVDTTSPKPNTSTSTSNNNVNQVSKTIPNTEIIEPKNTNNGPTFFL